MDNDKPNRPDDDYRAASQATAEDDYDDYGSKPVVTSPPAKRTNRLKPLLITLAVLVILAGLGLAFKLLFLKDKSEADNKKTTRTSQPSTATEEPVIDSQTEHYVSSTFMLEFDYPADWKVLEAEDGSKLTATSPALRLKTGSGQTVNGQAVLTIRNKQQAMPEFDKGNAVAVRESAKINYTKPSSVQRGSTYLSFLQYASSTSTSLDGAYITGDVGYQKGQAIPKADFTPVDPIISVTFVKCSDSSCSGGGTTAGVNPSMWDDDTFGKPLQTMLQSLVVN